MRCRSALKLLLLTTVSILEAWASAEATPPSPMLIDRAELAKALEHDAGSSGILFVRPGDVLLGSELSFYRHKLDSNLNTMAPPDLVSWRLPIRDVDPSKDEPLTNQERHFLGRFIASNLGEKLRGGLGAEPGDGPSPYLVSPQEGWTTSPTIEPDPSANPSDMADDFARFLWKNEGGAWSHLISRDKGGLSLRLTQSESGRPDYPTVLQARLTPVLAGAGIFVHQAPPANLDWFRSITGMDVSVDPYRNILGITAPNAPDEGISSRKPRWYSQDLDLAGNDISVVLQRNGVGWGSRQVPEVTWSLSDWQASRILGYVCRKISALWIHVWCPALDGKSGSWQPMRVEILWPGTTVVPNVKLLPGKNGTLLHPWPVGAASYPANPILGYLDLLKLAKLDPAGIQLCAFETAHTKRFIGLHEKPPSGALQAEFFWSSKQGLVVDPRQACKLSCVPCPPLCCAYLAQAPCYVPAKKFTTEMAKHVRSIQQWDIYRDPSPDVWNQITSVHLPNYGEVQIVGDLQKANLTATKDVLLGQVTVVPTVPLPPHASEPLKLHSRHLDELTPFHVDRVCGLSEEPLPGYKTGGE